jgi:histidinol-phosphate aminotransferase
MKYAREILRDVEGYVPGEQPKIANIIKLNTNENPYPPSPSVLSALCGMTPGTFRKYPDPVSLAFREKCAARYSFPGPEWAIVGNGMDEVLAMAIRTFMDPGDTLLTTYPTYTLYETLAQLHGAKIRMVELDDDFQLPESFFDTPARLCVLARPNAPSGVCAPREAVERLCLEFDGVVIVDEAYVDFADDNCMDFPHRFENAIVTRTFSKSFSLAGMRLGLGFAQPEIISEFLKTKDSYNMNAVAQEIGSAALGDYAHMEKNVAKVRATRVRLTDALTGMGFEIPPSQANFVLAQWNGNPSAKEIFSVLRERSVVVRYFDAPRLDNALRITVGTDGEIDALLAALRDVVG